MSIDKALVLLSGGLDSTVLLYHVKAQYAEVKAISFDYGQRHEKELWFAHEICGKLGVDWISVHISSGGSGGHVVLGGSSQTDSNVPVPEGHYAAENMKTTVVPNRNMIMLSIACGHAIGENIKYVYFAAHAGDHAIYPDCRRPFVDTFNTCVDAGNYQRVIVVAPFLNKRKQDIVELGAWSQVPFEKTWSCYKGGEKHCGKCGTCVERIEAFQLAGVRDPTEYE